MAEPNWDDGWQNDSESLMEFGESVVYVPRLGSERSITAVVTRRLPDPSFAVAGIAEPDITVRVRNSAVHGVAMTEFGRGDKFRLARRKGVTVADYAINGEPELQNAGTILFRIK